MILYGHCQDYCLWDFKKLTEENNDFVDIFHGFFFWKDYNYLGIWQN